MKMPHWPVPYGHKPIDLDLSRIKSLLAKLKNPELSIPPVIHVAGTNGKGSTIAFLKNIFENAGYKVHRYTSPHLVRFNERIEVAGQEIDDQALYSVIEECRIAAGDSHLTFFEGVTAAAFLAFSRFKADVVLLETGMGGRLDATNVIDNPLLSIITTISYDHMEYLGDTLSKIAAEKSGIIKSRSTCIVSWQYKEVMSVILKKCKEIGSEALACGEDWDCDGTDYGFYLTMGGEKMLFPKPSLVGLHQIMNAATAVASVKSSAVQNKYIITNENIEYGLQNTFWPARMQNIKNGVLYGLLPEDCELWLDGAHNTGGAEMLAMNIRLLFNDDKLLYLVNGRTKDRDIEGFLSYFIGRPRKLFCLQVQNEPLAEKAENIHKVAQNMGFKSQVMNSLRDSIIDAVKDARGSPFRILICGSLYLAGDVMSANHDFYK